MEPSFRRLRGEVSVVIAECEEGRTELSYLSISVGNEFHKL